ncbi:hypothetical protein [Nocardia sp. CDC160]|uniref:hypothetical protein n=1 Tax=Nocardia sp. CDC160 TaxID=3112166 RepID=UPI002DBA95D7|nr:hypothetical protein [Nocardia sp. CDC160]MEC3919225.1 hypothetical protein [Nocardia sp. CDC160]
MGDRCVKDLKLVKLEFVREAVKSTLVAWFEWNDKAPEALRVVYRQVESVEIEMAPAGPVQLDEIEPHDRGCRHEIQLIGGSIVAVCAHLEAKWIPQHPKSVVDDTGTTMV